jgi:hypothetical protein
MSTAESPYKHYRLQSLDSFRLLRLLPSRNKPHKICIKLIEEYFFNMALYEALSYTWGLFSDKKPI